MHHADVVMLEEICIRFSHREHWNKLLPVFLIDKHRLGRPFQKAQKIGLQEHLLLFKILEVIAS